jgi:polysaccharide biosynthesis protein PelF
MIDVCLLLEGSYPYVAGGVSTWVHELITTMKDIRFGIVYIAPHSDPTRKLKYDLPNHVVYLKEISLHDYNLEKYRVRDPKGEDFDLVKTFYEDMLRGSYKSFPEFIKLFRGETCSIDSQSFFSSERIWEELKVFYNQFGEEISFIDFFWTWRGTHLPLMQILNADIPRAKIYHAISTGYAGLLGSIAKLTYGKKFFLTEHGIYTHERLLEISQATWVYEKEKKNYRVERQMSLLKRWWIGMFKVMSQITYENVDQIYTLYEGNKIREVIEGADPEKIQIIPNGINIKSFTDIVAEKRDNPQIGFIGRVVPIKDVKTFIMAAQSVLEEMPNAEFYIIGPTDEELDYFEECQRLVEGLHLEQKITFTGRGNIHEYFKFLDLIVLTSLSEAQPYAILEANAAGIPVVASNVGDCIALVEGREPLDRAFGPSGIITEVSNHISTAAGIIKLLQDKKFYESACRAGKKRTETYYDVDDLRSRYLNIYEQNL